VSAALYEQVFLLAAAEREARKMARKVRPTAREVAESYFKPTVPAVPPAKAKPKVKRGPRKRVLKPRVHDPMPGLLALRLLRKSQSNQRRPCTTIRVR
jgi:hypothetical protein